MDPRQVSDMAERVKELLASLLQLGMSEEAMSLTQGYVAVLDEVQGEMDCRINPPPSHVIIEELGEEGTSGPAEPAPQRLRRPGEQSRPSAATPPRPPPEKRPSGGNGQDSAPGRQGPEAAKVPERLESGDSQSPGEGGAGKEEEEGRATPSPSPAARSAIEEEVERVRGLHREARRLRRLAEEATTEALAAHAAVKERSAEGAAALASWDRVCVLENELRRYKAHLREQEEERKRRERQKEAERELRKQEHARLLDEYARIAEERRKAERAVEEKKREERETAERLRKLRATSPQPATAGNSSAAPSPPAQPEEGPRTQKRCRVCGAPHVRDYKKCPNRARHHTFTTQFWEREKGRKK